MNILKKTLTVLLVVCMLLCLGGCGRDIDKFKTAGVYIIDCTGGQQYKYIIDHPTDATSLLTKVKSLTWEENPDALPGTAYLFLRFYNADLTEEVVFTLYDNGTCCWGRDYETLYTVEKGRSAYIELVRMYEASQNIDLAENFVENQASKAQ